MECELCGEAGKHSPICSRHDNFAQPSVGSAGYGALTEREKWLMRKAYETGFIDKHTGIRNDLDNWLENSARDGVTVEMVLAKEAP